MEKKKILFVTKSLWYGGITTALTNLLNNLDYEKMDVTLLVCQAYLGCVDEINSNCKIIIADREKKYSFKKMYTHKKLFHMLEEPINPSFLHRKMMWTIPVIKYIENYLFIKYIKREMENCKYDAVLIYNDEVAEIAIRSIKADKYIMFYHHGAMRHVYHDKIAYKKCDKIIAVSKSQANLIKKSEPRFANKVIIINNIADIAGIRKKAENKIDEKFENDITNIVSVGRISYEKGMDIAVGACKKLVEEGYFHFHWWIVGDGPEREKLEENVKNDNLQNNLSFIGNRSNPYPYMKKADIYVQPSRVEAYPMAILEALIIGQPVVSIDNEGAREIIEQGKNGFLVAENDLAQLLGEIIGKKKIIDQLKDNIVVEDFEKKNEEIIRDLEEILEINERKVK